MLRLIKLYAFIGKRIQPNILVNTALNTFHFVKSTQTKGPFIRSFALPKREPLVHNNDKSNKNELKFVQG